eukprot:6406074-Karenia_brevis.AAC.1
MFNAEGAKLEDDKMCPPDQQRSASKGKGRYRRWNGSKTNTVVFEERSTTMAELGRRHKAGATHIRESAKLCSSLLCECQHKGVQAVKDTPCHHRIYNLLFDETTMDLSVQGQPPQE